jgi:hypothetical protein
MKLVGFAKPSGALDVQPVIHQQGKRWIACVTSRRQRAQSDDQSG